MKASIHKFTIYVIDFDEYSSNEIKYDLEQIRDESIKAFPEGKVDIVWRDEIDINQINSSKEIYERYFSDNTRKDSEKEKEKT